MKWILLVLAAVLSGGAAVLGFIQPHSVATPEAMTVNAQVPAERFEPGLRERFQKQMAQVKYGMTKEEVAKLLGLPDTKQPTKSYDGKSEVIIWLYGTTRGDDFATLGTVRFGPDEKVESFAPVGNPPAEHIDESSMRRGLRLLHNTFEQGHRRDLIATSRLYSPYTDLDPLQAIKFVNAVISLENAQRGVILREYMRLGGIASIISFNILFEIPEIGYLESPRIGVWDTPRPHNKSEAPRYPYFLIDGVPLSPLNGPSGEGKAETPISYLNRLLNAASMWPRPLRPTDRPWEIVEKLRRDALVGANEGILENARRQILHMLSDVYPYGRYCGRVPMHTTLSKPWEDIVSELKALNIRWDEKLDEYVMPSGKTLPPAQPSSKGSHDKITWEPSNLAPHSVKIEITRLDTGGVRIDLIGGDCDIWKFNVHLLGYTADKKVLDAKVLTGIGYLRTTFALPEDASLHLICESTEGTDTSPELKP
jgi:hypothetical protein